MRFARVARVAAVVFALAPSAFAQQTPAQRVVVEKAVAPQFVVKTVELHHLTSAEAVKLLEPYSRSNGGGVFDVSPSIRAVTIRETPTIFAEMMAVLERYDRDPANVSLNFQLIAADNNGARDPSVAGLDSLLRGVLKFSGYRLLGTSVVSAGEREQVSQNIPADHGSYGLSVDVSDLRVAANDASVHLNVSLWRTPIATQGGRAPISPRILMTGVTVPIGQTVVLGTTASGENSLQRALILTVRPQLAPAKK